MPPKLPTLAVGPRPRGMSWMIPGQIIKLNFKCNTFLFFKMAVIIIIINNNVYCWSVKLHNENNTQIGEV